jgi:hypothetical protein
MLYILLNWISAQIFIPKNRWQMSNWTRFLGFIVLTGHENQYLTTLDILDFIRKCRPKMFCNTDLRHYVVKTRLSGRCIHRRSRRFGFESRHDITSHMISHMISHMTSHLTWYLIWYLIWHHISHDISYDISYDITSHMISHMISHMVSHTTSHLTWYLIWYLIRHHISHDISFHWCIYNGLFVYTYRKI